MPVIKRSMSTLPLNEQKKNLLHDVECGAIVTALCIATAAYTESIVVAVIAGVFLLAEISCSYGYFCFCNKCRDNTSDK